MAGRLVIRRLTRRLTELRQLRNTAPFTDAQMALLREVPAEGKALRRHRSKRRWLLLKGSAS